MSKNVAVFVDVANIFYAAKAAGVDIDYVTLLKASSAGRDLVRAYAYTGLDPDNENQRNFHDFLRRHGYKVVSKDIRKYGDGKVKANLDIELVVDMMKTARNLDIAIVISGDGDFAPAIRAVQEMGVRVEVVSFRGNTSSDLIDVADQFTDITQIAKVEKGSSRSGRRVADDDEDLSMTEVPDKQSEGTGEARRGRGRGRSRTAEPVAAAAPSGRTGATRGRRAAPVAAVATGSDVPLVVLPGEKLSRVAAPAMSADRAEDEAEPAPVGGSDAEISDEMADAGGPAFESAEDGARRRRRRRGGRGRGRGRREEGVLEAGPAGPDRPEADVDEDEFEAPPPPARRPAASAFGSVWDSQIGVPSAAGTREPIAGGEPFADDEDLDEPPIPEYLIAERRQRDSGGRPGRGGAGRGRGGAYAAAMDRERFGGGRGSQVSRYGDAGPRRNGNPNRIDRPERRDRPERMDRPDRAAFRPESRPAPRPVSSEEPWSEVPPEIEAMLRAQLSSGGGGRSSTPSRPVGRPTAQPGGEAAPPQLDDDAVAAASVGELVEMESSAAKRPARRTSRRTTSPAPDAAQAAAGDSPAGEAPARRRTSRATKAVDTSVSGASSGGVAAEIAPAEAEIAPAQAAGRRVSSTSRSTRAPKATPAPATDPATEGVPEVAAPKRRTRRTADTPA